MNIIGIVTPVAQWLGAANSCINPILYAFLNKKFRSGFLTLVHSETCCGGLRNEDIVRSTIRGDSQLPLPLRGSTIRSRREASSIQEKQRVIFTVSGSSNFSHKSRSFHQSFDNKKLYGSSPNRHDLYSPKYLSREENYFEGKRDYFNVSLEEKRNYSSFSVEKEQEYACVPPVTGSSSSAHTKLEARSCPKYESGDCALVKGQETKDQDEMRELKTFEKNEGYHLNGTSNYSISTTTTIL